MNKVLVKQLYEQALVESGRLFNFQVTNLHVAERLTELIVRHCAQEILVFDAEPISHKSAAQLLLQHFGVDDGTKP